MLPALLFVVTEDWYFVSHRLPLARAAKAAGYRVMIASRFGSHEASLRAEGFETIPLKLRRRTASIRQEIAAVVELRRLYRAHRPVIVHQVALKPVALGAIAAWMLRDVWLVNAIAGLGVSGSTQSRAARVRRALVLFVLRRILRRRASAVLVQNSTDRALLTERGGVDPGRITLLCGAGVDLEEFVASPEPDGVPVFLFAGRFLWDKGVADFVEAARLLRGEGHPARFVLVGSADADSPGSVPLDAIQSWSKDGVVEQWGRRSDMPAVLANASVVCLPSRYGEGVPKILLEAAASGRPVVTTDWPGCRDAVHHGETGLLVAPGDVGALADAMRTLLVDPELRRRYGAAARQLAEREFDVRRVVAQTIDCYRRLVHAGPR